MASPRMNADSTPICRCRVLYLGSAVPHVTKDGLQGIQEPLRELYPEQGAIGARGIDSWLSVWSNGILLENVDENHKKVTRFFPIETLHYCAAVRYVLVPEKSPGTSSTQPRFLPLDSPFARSPNPNHPPLFACILRRTTGIKVLECHTFICKREMAANALVRCCFHAYADSAYARHIDSGTGGYSVYGTVRTDGRMTSDPVSIEKVEGWRRTAPTMTGTGSTLTLDSALHTAQPHQPVDPENSNSADDLSIYNGDENHKIWAGSGREDDVSYGEFGVNTVRSTRSSRPRQTVSAPPPPPPPAKERSKKATKERGKKKKGKSVGGGREETYPSMNGSLLRSGTWKGSGVGVYPGPGPGRGGRASAGGNYPMMMLAATLPHPHPHPKSPPPLLIPTPPRILPPNSHFLSVPPQHSLYLHPGRKPSKNYPVTMEEPIYMPSNRPMSPVSSYQPCHFPHEAYLMQQYATTEDPKRRPRDKHKKNVTSFTPHPDAVEWNEPVKGKEKKRGKSGTGSSTVDPRSAEEDPEILYNTAAYRRKEGDAKSDNRSNGYKRDDDDGDSLYNTGIYRRKGHLNERAFSYSIRQEHRSRSYGSLANLKFAPLPVVPNGGGPPVEAQYYGVTKEEMKKEREIMQMMQDLELSGDELERSEVPPGVYQPANQRNNKIRR